MSPEARQLFTERRRWPRFWKKYWLVIAVAIVLGAAALDSWLVRYLSKQAIAHERAALDLEHFRCTPMMWIYQ
jgi:hypothetical protein